MHTLSLLVRKDPVIMPNQTVIWEDFYLLFLSLTSNRQIVRTTSTSDRKSVSVVVIKENTCLIGFFCLFTGSALHEFPL